MFLTNVLWAILCARHQFHKEMTTSSPKVSASPSEPICLAERQRSADWVCAAINSGEAGQVDSEGGRAQEVWHLVSPQLRVKNRLKVQKSLQLHTKKWRLESGRPWKCCRVSSIKHRQIRGYLLSFNRFWGYRSVNQLTFKGCVSQRRIEAEKRQLFSPQTHVDCNQSFQDQTCVSFFQQARVERLETAFSAYQTLALSTQNLSTLVWRVVFAP